MNESKIIETYLGGCTFTATSELHGVSIGTIQRILKANNIKTRGHVEAGQGINKLNLPDSIIAAKYLSGVSASELGKEYNTSGGVILNHLRKFGTPIRTISESIKLAFEKPEVKESHTKAQQRRWLDPKSHEDHSKAVLASEKFCAVKQTGSDMVGHHIAYDFDRPDAFVVQVTRSHHGSIHNPKGTQRHKKGYSLID